MSENNLNAYRARNDSVDLTFETQSLLEQLVKIENQLTELEFVEAKSPSSSPEPPEVRGAPDQGHDSTTTGRS